MKNVYPRRSIRDITLDEIIKNQEKVIMENNKVLTVKDFKKDEEVQALIKYTDFQLENLGFTEHSQRHLSIVSSWAKELAEKLDVTEREIRLVEIAGYLHDIGNSINRHDHAMNGAILAYNILTKKGMPYEDACEIMTAIGNHDENDGYPVSRLAALLIIADKADVHRSRVRYKNRSVEGVKNDIHDRVNYAVESSYLDVVGDDITLNITIDTDICSVMDYFEIYLARMKLCGKSAAVFNKNFKLVINGAELSN